MIAAVEWTWGAIDWLPAVAVGAGFMLLLLVAAYSGAPTGRGVRVSSCRAQGNRHRRAGPVSLGTFVERNSREAGCESVPGRGRQQPEHDA